MLDWIRDNDALLWWLGGASVIMFIGTLIAVPILVARIPADYFTHPKRRATAFARRHPVIRWVLRIGKNLLGIIFIAAGVAMLILPGQGILTIVIGVLLLDFPGKFRLERRLIGQRSVLKSINWLRKRRGREPLVLSTETHH